jgi:hypothetical protein
MTLELADLDGFGTVIVTSADVTGGRSASACRSTCSARW